MLNRVILSIVAVLFAVNANSQVVRIDSFESAAANTALSTNGMMAYAYNISENGRGKSAVLEILFCYADYSNVKKLKIDINKGSKVLASQFGDEGFAFLLGDAARQTRSLLMINAEGAIYQQYTEQQVAAADLANSDNYYLYSGMGTTYMIAPVYSKNGYRAVIFDGELKPLQDKTYTGKAGMEVLSVKLMMDRLLILRKETLNTKDRKYEYTIQQLLGNMPEMASITELKDEQDYCFPMFINGKDGMVFTAGLFYKNGKYEEGKAGGIMVFQLSPDGNIQRKIKLPMSRINQFLPDATIAALTKNAHLAVQDAYYGMGGGSVVVAELLHKTQKGKDAVLKVADMMVLHTNMEDDLAKLQFVERAPETSIAMSGTGAANNILNNSEWLMTHNLYNYRFSMMLVGQQHICYQASDTNQVSSSVWLIPADSAIEALGTRMLVSMLPDPKRQMMRKARVSVNTESPDDARKAFYRYYGFLPTPTMQMFVYNYSTSVLQWSIEPIRK
ncbi:hypothetical protein CAP35_15285 [Chitinophagaceae bacterium IBVUCB1]|nr:hypothetical protein CAP35_15285 [Chitinophagaceae bacterium IBVUCB1]